MPRRYDNAANFPSAFKMFCRQRKRSEPVRLSLCEAAFFGSKTCAVLETHAVYGVLSLSAITAYFAAFVGSFIPHLRWLSTRRKAYTFSYLVAVRPIPSVRSRRPVKTSKRIKLFSKYPRAPVVKSLRVKRRDSNSLSKSIISSVNCRQNETLFEPCRVRDVRFLIFPPLTIPPTTDNWPTLLQRYTENSSRFTVYTYGECSFNDRL